MTKTNIHSMRIECIINGFEKIIEILPNEKLSEVLRREGYFGVKRGCAEGSCGTCTVLLNGIAVKSCILFAAQAHKCKITTIEGIGTRENPHPLQSAFVSEGAIQCGFCIPGILLSAKALLDENKSPTIDEIKEALDGNLCRCTGYSGQIKAVMNAAQILRSEKE